LEVYTGHNFFQFLHSTWHWCLIWTLSLNHEANSTLVPLCSSTCLKLFILSLILNYLRFPLLSIFHTLAVKFVLTIKVGFYEVKLHGHRDWRI
jgi:hypothetical protein